MRTYAALRIKPNTTSDEFGDLVAAILDDFGVIAVEEVDGDGTIRAFLSEPSLRPRATHALLDSLPGVTVEEQDVPDGNWAERSQASLKTVRVGALSIAPPWDVPGDNGTRTIIVLPSMGFGTGHHATTRLCLAALQTIALSGKSVLDVGTGSGVLAIAALRLGAERVLAVDNDQDAIDNAIENGMLNQLPLDARCLSLEAQDIAAKGPFDVLLANLTGGALVRYVAILQSLTHPSGAMVLSGLREEEEQSVREAYREFETGDRNVEDGWVCLVLRRTQA